MKMNIALVAHDEMKNTKVGFCIAYEEILKKFEKVYAYGMLTYHLDMSNQDGIKIFKEVENLGTEFNVATSFIIPEITYANEDRIKEYIKEERFKE